VSRVEREGGVVLLVESPHKDEFEGATREPLGPLRQSQTRRNLSTHLSRSIESAEAPRPDVDVVIANPVQFQASLVDFMVDLTVGLRPCIRNTVWKSLFSDDAVKRDFASRMRAYSPSLVVLAPTYELKRWVLNAVRDLSLPSCRLVQTTHPSYWHRVTPIVSVPAPL
jgi:hypothetical protein